MPHVGPVLEGGAYFCPHCGALYSLTHLLTSSESNSATCVVCLKIMDKWNTTKIPSFRLIQRPEDA
jgi:hypothetical protein